MCTIQNLTEPLNDLKLNRLRLHVVENKTLIKPRLYRIMNEKQFISFQAVLTTLRTATNCSLSNVTIGDANRG
jgi:hypothetical protein